MNVTRADSALAAHIEHASGRRRVCECGAEARFICDWKGNRVGRCDAYACLSCAVSPAPGKHLCPAHSRMWNEMQAAKQRCASN